MPIRFTCNDARDYETHSNIPSFEFSTHAGRDAMDMLEAAGVSDPGRERGGELGGDLWGQELQDARKASVVACALEPKALERIYLAKLFKLLDYAVEHGLVVTWATTPATW